MCFGGGSSPQAPVEQPAAPVDVISAGQPTVTVAPNKAASTNPSPGPSSPAAQNSGSNTGLTI